MGRTRRPKTYATKAAPTTEGAVPAVVNIPETYGRTAPATIAMTMGTGTQRATRSPSPTAPSKMTRAPAASAAPRSSAYPACPTSVAAAMVPTVLYATSSGCRYRHESRTLRTAGPPYNTAIHVAVSEPDTANSRASASGKLSAATAKIVTGSAMVSGGTSRESGRGNPDRAAVACRTPPGHRLSALCA